MIKHLNWIVPALIATALATPALAQTKEADQKYCNALVEAHHKLVEGSGDRMQGNRPRSLEVSTAIEQCRSGETAKAIPTLEKNLRDQKVALPAR
jgi:hypothetical protein